MPHEFCHDVTYHFRVLRFRQLIPFRISSRMQPPYHDASADLNPPTVAHGRLYAEPCRNSRGAQVVEGGCAGMTEAHIVRGGCHG